MLGALVGGGCCAFAGPVADEQCELLRQAYLANREKFDAFSCEFDWITAEASSVEAALAGDLENPVLAHVRWVVDGSRQRYELVCATEESQQIPAPVGDNLMVYVPCLEVTTLTDGQIGFGLVGRLSNANVSRRLGPEPDILNTPLSLGAMGDNEKFGPGLQPRVDEKLTVTIAYGGQAEDGGRALEILVQTFAWKDVGSSETRWSLDPAHGYLPVEVEYAADPTHSRCIVTAIRACDNGGFMPERWVFFQNADGPPPLHVRVLELRELSLAKPQEDDFAVELPAGVGIVNPTGDMRASFDLQQPEVVRLGELESWLQRCDEALQAALAADNAAQPIPRARVWPWVVGAFAAALALIALSLARKRRGRSAGGPAV